jgi:hypothetical protein
MAVRDRRADRARQVDIDADADDALAVIVAEGRAPA